MSGCSAGEAGGERSTELRHKPSREERNREAVGKMERGPLAKESRVEER